MSSTSDAISRLPDVSFIDNMSLEDMQELLISKYKEKYEEITGDPAVIRKGDPMRIILLAAAQYLYQGLMQIDKAGKMNFVKYAYGDYLDHLAASKGLERLAATPATVTVTWSLAEARAADTVIPAGTRVTADWQTYFATTQEHTITAGETEISVLMTCTQAGSDGNGFAAGEITRMADPVAFISSVENTTASSGGTDTETDDHLRERIYNLPSVLPSGGTEDYYRYQIGQSGIETADVNFGSVLNGHVGITFIKADGSLPSAADNAALRTYLSDPSRKPLGDQVEVGFMGSYDFSIDVTYYIRKSDAGEEAAIKAAVEQAVADYRTWQTSRIGIDISPDNLISRMIQAGAKRVTVTAPSYAAVYAGYVVICESTSITYGGLEDD